MRTFRFATALAVAIALIAGIADSATFRKAAKSAKTSPVPESRLKWEPAIAEAGPTASFKYQLRIVPDGSGGAVIAWEENRFRKACCRDLRDVYAQRFDRSGKPMWGEGDVPFAREDSGEELVGLVTRSDGGTLALWRRDTSVFLAQEISGSGTVLLEPRGRILAPCRGNCEWNPLEAFVEDRTGASALACWVETGKAAQLKVMKALRSGDSFVYTPSNTVMNARELRSASAVPVGDGWLVSAWQRLDEGGARIAGLWLNADGTPRGEVFTVARDPAHRWINMQWAQAAGGRAFVLWNAVNPDGLGRTHALNLSLVGAGKSGAGRTMSVVVGEATTSAMYIPPTTVELEATVSWTGETKFSNETAENIFWRRTSSLLPDGKGGCLVWWVSDDSLKVAQVRAGAQGISVGKALRTGASLDTGFTPFMLPAGENRFLLVWSEKRARIWRVMAQFVSVGGSGITMRGRPETLIADSPEAPRWAGWAPAGPASAWMGLSTLTEGGKSVSLRLGLLSWN